MMFWPRLMCLVVALHLGVAASCSDSSVASDGIIDLVETRNPLHFEVELKDDGSGFRTIAYAESRPLTLRILEGREFVMEDVERVDFICEEKQVVGVSLRISHVDRDRVEAYFESVCHQFDMRKLGRKGWPKQGEGFGRRNRSAIKMFPEEFVEMHFHVRFPREGFSDEDVRPQLVIKFIPESLREDWSASIQLMDFLKPE